MLFVVYAYSFAVTAICCRLATHACSSNCCKLGKFFCWVGQWWMSSPDCILVKNSRFLLLACRFYGMGCSMWGSSFVVTWVLEWILNLKVGEFSVGIFGFFHECALYASFGNYYLLLLCVAYLECAFHLAADVLFDLGTGLEVLSPLCPHLFLEVAGLGNFAKV